MNARLNRMIRVGLGGLMLNACAGLIHDPTLLAAKKKGASVPKITATSFEMTTLSDFDVPAATWNTTVTDEAFGRFECQVQRLSQIDNQVVESGPWFDCQSPFDLTQDTGIAVDNGFHGQFTVRAVSKSGNPGLEVTKPFRRSIWAKGFSNYPSSLALQGDSLFVGGMFQSELATRSWRASRIARLNANGSVDLSVSTAVSGFNDQVRSLVRQADGKILVGGGFSAFDNSDSASDRLIRINSDGSFDPTFSGIGTGFDSLVFSVALQSDGKILVGGSFVQMNGVPSTPDRLVRLNSDGSIDTSFDDITTGFGSSSVRKIIIQPGGEILAGGAFTSYNSNSGAPDNLIRLTNTGAVDTTFNAIGSGFNNTVNEIALQSDGKIIVGGDFTSLDGNASAPDKLVRLNSNGSLDTTFNGLGTGFNDSVFAILVQSDGKILVGGGFSSVNGVSVPYGLVRLNSNGSLDSTFNGLTSGFSSLVYTITEGDSGTIWVGGTFSGVNGDSSIPDGMVLLNSDGSISTQAAGRSPNGFSDSVYAILPTPDGKMWVGGNFTEVNLEAIPRGVAKARISTASDSSRFGLGDGLDGSVNAIQVQADGKILVGGYFSEYNGDPSAPDQLLRLNADGTLDTSFSGLGTGFDFDILALALQADGKILVGGQFTSINGNGSVPDRLVRLNADGSVDPTFNGVTTGFSGPIQSIAVMQDGRVLVGGWPGTFNGSPTPGGIMRLTSSGANDPTFNGVITGFDYSVYTITELSDGRILVGGGFQEFNGNSSAPDMLVRLNPNGSLDSTFNGLGTGFNAAVQAVAVMSDGRIWAAGQFDSLNGNSSIPKSLVRLLSDGSLDPSFTGSGLNEQVFTLLLDQASRLYVGGAFTTFNGDSEISQRLIRLNPDGTLDQSFLGQIH